MINNCVIILIIEIRKGEVLTFVIKQLEWEGKKMVTKKYIQGKYSLPKDTIRNCSTSKKLKKIIQGAISNFIMVLFFELELQLLSMQYILKKYNFRSKKIQKRYAFRIPRNYETIECLWKQIKSYANEEYLISPLFSFIIQKWKILIIRTLLNQYALA